MPTLEENKQVWGSTYDWSRGGVEWSIGWGSVDMQWYGTLLPRVHRFLPADHVLEIAPGFGRWTQYLKDHSRKLTLVDLSARCIAACRERFAADQHLNYHVND